MSYVPYMKGYEAIKSFYADRCAARSQVPLMNHIDEGIKILQARKANITTIEAWCLHPIYQNDSELMNIGLVDHPYTTPLVMLYAMEYRNAANRYLAKHILPEGGVQLSCIPEVNEMLVADKVQNRKDFEIHHKGKHANSDRLDAYFKEWLAALGVSEAQYQQYVEMLS